MDAYKFRVGDIIHHRRYDYRGVIVAADPQCTADEDWYQRNQTQPRRDQPWYHVVVDQASHMTYVAEEHLEPDPDGGPVHSVLLARTELYYHRGRYYAQPLN